MGRPYSFSDGSGIVNEHTLVAIKYAMDSGVMVKPHLRRLEDMTEDEMNEVFKVQRWEYDTSGEVIFAAIDGPRGLMPFNCTPATEAEYLAANPSAKLGEKEVGHDK